VATAVTVPSDIARRKSVWWGTPITPTRSTWHMAAAMLAAVSTTEHHTAPDTKPYGGCK
jgi:hypothetical protein